ncbi:MAG: hypothetical protein WDW38_005206 [Sanguina aurantia]
MNTAAMCGPQAPISAARRTSVVVCSAATEVVDAPPAPAAVEGPKGGVAKLSFQRGSVHKVRRVLDIIRGRTYEDALLMMEYMPYRACEKIIKLLVSAAANAKNNNGALKSKLYVAEAFANGGPALKRMRPRAQGRGVTILKPTFHAAIRVAEKL